MPFGRFLSDHFLLFFDNLPSVGRSLRPQTSRRRLPPPPFREPFIFTDSDASLRRRRWTGDGDGLPAGEREEKKPEERRMRKEVGKTGIVMVCGSLVYYHCAFRESSLLSLLSDVLIVLLCSLAILGLLFRHLNISVPVDPLEWQISQETACGFVACIANTLGATESVLRVAATGHDKRFFVKVIACLYLLSVIGRLVSGVTVAYVGLCLFCIYTLVENSPTVGASISRLFPRTGALAEQDDM